MTYKNRDPHLFLQDIYQAAQSIINYTENIEYTDFIVDKKTFEAVCYNLIVIGEASKHIPEALKKQLKEVPFDEILGLRNRLAHDYLGIDNSILWSIINHDIPDLKQHLEKFL